MKKRYLVTCTFCAISALPGGVRDATGAEIPFTESFNADSANWADTAGAPLSWASTGGADGGGFAFGTFNFVGSSADDDTVMLRGQSTLGASGGAFAGNWIDDGVTQFSAFVRHNASEPLTFFTRFASPFNFPGAVAIHFAPVPAGEWTPLIIGMDAANPQFVSFEGTDFDTVFSNIGNIQIGVRIPEGLAGIDADVQFDLDLVSIVPEPASLVLVALGGVGMIHGRRHRRSSR